MCVPPPSCKTRGIAGKVGSARLDLLTAQWLAERLECVHHWKEQLDDIYRVGSGTG